MMQCIRDNQFDMRFRSDETDPLVVRRCPCICTLAGVMSLILMLCCALPVVAQDRVENPDAPDPAEVEACIDRGVAHLLSQAQNDGSIGQENQHKNAMVSLTIMAMVAVGHQPTDQSPEGKLLRDALNFILRDDRISDEGYFGYSDGSRMYGHGITTLMLCEMMGMGVDDTQDALIERRAQAALNLILRSQRVRKHADEYQGGWRYDPGSRDSDLSVTVWQLMSLRAGKASGLDVPSEAIDDAVAYLERSYHETGDGKGGFGYEPRQNPRYATTAAGMLAMLVCGQYEHVQVAGAANYLMESTPTVNRNDQWFYYGTYYYAMAMYQVGGEYAVEAENTTWDALHQAQQQDGSWTSQHYNERHGVYSTCMAILALSVRHHYLPIYQR